LSGAGTAKGRCVSTAGTVLACVDVLGLIKRKRIY
jgi:hypothetical protein